MADKPQVTAELSRELSLFQIIMMALGMMIGAGVFLGIGNSIRHAGPGGVVLTFALNGVIALFTAMAFAELSSAIPRAGGAYNFARIGFGRGTSFLAGWMEWFASSVAGSMYAVTLAIYSVRYLQQLGLLDWAEPHAALAERLLRSFLAVADDLERALAAAHGNDTASVRRGLEMTHQKLMNMLKQEGVESIDARNQLFDPNWHEAVSVVQRNAVEELPQTVADVLEPGYRLGDRLLRPAKVVVAS